jgi:cell division transport system permease protein
MENLGYSVREGINSFRRAQFSTFASTSAIVVTLALIGVFTLLGYHASGVTAWLKQEVGEIEVFLTAHGESQVATLRTTIFNHPAVDSVTFISRQDAEKIFMEEFGEEGDVFLGESFLPPSLKVHVKPEFATVDNLTQLVAYLWEQAGVDDVTFNRPLLVRVQANLRLFTLVSITIAIVVILASLFLVLKTIRLSIYARRLLIRTMKLVGATDGFIQRPFLVEGMIQGLIGGVIASIILVLFNSFLVDYISLLQVRPWPGGTAVIPVVLLLVAGIVIGWLGSRFATRRFIKKVELH